MNKKLQQISNVLNREAQQKLNLHASRLSKGDKESGANPSSKPFPNTVPNQGPIKGEISTIGQEQVVKRAWAPLGATHVRFQCRGGGAPKPAFACTAESQGAKYSGGGFGNLQTFTTIDIPIATSNEFIKITFVTTDSNGGYASWEFIKK